MAKVRVEGFLEVPSNRLGKVAAAIPDHIALTRAEPGCLDFTVSQDAIADDKFLLWGIFVDQTAFAQHQARAGSSPWGLVTAGLDHHYIVTADTTEDAAPAGDTGRFPLSDVVRQRAGALGQPGLDWLDELLSGLEHDWQITIGPALAGGTSALVAEATTVGGDSAILKVRMPGTAAGDHEAEVLQAAAGKGYPRLLRHDPSRNALLLERLGNRLDTMELPYEREVDIICAALLHAWMPVPEGFSGVTGADKANGLAQSILGRWAGAGQPCAQQVIDTALMYCRDRAAAYRAQSAVLAHGKPHARNTLAVPDTANPVQYKFIEPCGLAIEPAYDLGVLLSGWHEGVGGRNAHTIARGHARHLTTRTQVPAEAIWQWGYIERVATGLRLLENGEIDRGKQFLALAEIITSTAR